MFGAPRLAAEPFIIVNAECGMNARRVAPDPAYSVSADHLSSDFRSRESHESHESYAKYKSVLGPIEIVRPPVSGYLRATALTSSSVIRLYWSAISAGVLNACSFSH